MHKRRFPIPVAVSRTIVRSTRCNTTQGKKRCVAKVWRWPADRTPRTVSNPNQNYETKPIPTPAQQGATRRNATKCYTKRHPRNRVEPKPKLRNEANPVLCFQQKRNAEANFDPSPRIIARGLLEAKKIAAMAEAYYVGVAPHNPLGPIANAAALHFALSTPNFLIQEDMLADVPLIPICSGDFSDCAPVAGWLRRVARIHPAQSGFWITGPHRDRACAGFVPRKSGPTAGGAVYAS